MIRCIHVKTSVFKLASLMTVLTLSLVAQPEYTKAGDLDDAPEINIESVSAAQPRAMTALERPPHEPVTGSFAATTNAQDLESAPEYQAEANGSQASINDSGFYLRGTLGGSLKVESEQNIDGNPKSNSRIGNAFSVSGSVGYAFNDILRLEGEVGYLGNMEFKNIAGSPQKFDGTIFGVNAFADLGTVVGITPYVGGGLGGAKLKGADTRLRFNAQAGFAYKLNEKINLEFGYEYSRILGGDLDLNGVKYSQDAFDMHMLKIGTRIKF